ncbi:MAG TPA: hypothetical protein PK114_05665 [Smithellaceae bacterium]|nr:hypothetical protein [Smithellaceae bacterium]
MWNKIKTTGGLSILLLIFFAAAATGTYAQQSKASLSGTWAVKYADNSEGTMNVGKNNFTINIPEVGAIKGMIQTSGDYFESILSDRQNGINFLFGYIKGNKLEGKLQEKIPCAELKKAFKSGVAVGTNTCQSPFTAVKK